MSKNIGVDAAKLAGLQKDMMSKLLGGNLTIEQVEWWLNQSKKTREGLAKGDMIVSNAQILHRLYPDEEILVGATTGQETIAEANEVFPGYLDPNFQKWGTNKPSGNATEPTLAEVYELQKKAIFKQMFGSLGNIDDLCWEQGQIIDFVKNHRDKLHPKGYSTFFPFKVEGLKEPLVAIVFQNAGELEASVCWFGYGRVWRGGGRLWLVVPQLES